MYKVDLHTHSEASPDGGVTLEAYRRILEAGILDCIAITDHNRIDFATQAQKALGNQIIVGEEIMTSLGEIIGLFLSKAIRPGMSPEDTITAIQAQNGLVYIPHPFETVRKGLSPQTLELIQDHVDILEVRNGRAFVQNRSQDAHTWATRNHVIMAASSDAHGTLGLGRTFTALDRMPNRDTITSLLKTGTLHTKRPKVRELLYPKYHKTRKKITKK